MVVYIIILISCTATVGAFCYMLGLKHGHHSTVLRYFPEDSLHLVIPYSDITKERAEEIAKFIIVKKELHERSNMDG